MSDCLTPSSERCDCALPFALLGQISGGTADVLSLPTSNGWCIAIHPNVFHAVLEALPVAEYQVGQTADAIRIPLVRPRSEVTDNEARSAIERALEHAGAAHVVARVDLPSDVERTGAAKAPRVKPLRGTAPVIAEASDTQR